MKNNGSFRRTTRSAKKNRFSRGNAHAKNLTNQFASSYKQDVNRLIFLHIWANLLTFVRENAELPKELNFQDTLNDKQDIL